MKKLIILIITITYSSLTYSQIDFCPKEVTNLDLQKMLIAKPDFELPILNIYKMYNPDNSQGGPFIKSIKLPDFLMGMLLSDNKTYLGYSDNYLYHINIETEKINALPFVSKGKLDNNEKFTWEKVHSQYNGGTLYLYKHSKTTNLPLNIYKFNKEAMRVDLVWETGLKITSEVDFNNITNTSYWTYADRNGNTLIIDITTKQIVAKHKFSVPAEITNSEKTTLFIDFSVINTNTQNTKCNEVKFSISDTDAKPRKSYYCKYNLHSKKMTNSIYTEGAIYEQVSNGKSYWFILKNHKDSQSFKVYNDDKLNDIRFEFNDLKKSGLPWSIKKSKEGVLETFTISYPSGKKETYDWNTKKLLKTKEVKIDITDF